MVKLSPAADRLSVRCTALACLVAAVARAQSPQELAAASQRESILRQQQSLSAQLQGAGSSAGGPASASTGGAPPIGAGRDSWVFSAPDSRQPAPQAAVSAQLASVQRQLAALAHGQASPIPAASAGVAPPLIPSSPDPQPAVPAGQGHDEDALAVNLASQRDSAARQPRLSWQEPPEPASLFDCAPLPVSALAPIFDRAAASFSLESSLLRAVARKESSFQPCAVSRSGALGLMQLMPETAAALGVSDPFDAEQSIFGGARFLRFLLDRFQNDLSLALSAYNAGPARVEQFGGIPPFAETRDYVSSILRSLGKPPPE